MAPEAGSAAGAASGAVRWSKVGLTSEEAEVRRARHGPNALPEPAPPRLWRRFLVQFRSPIIYVLLAALAFEIGTWAMGGHDGFPVEGLAIVVILLANAGLGVWQERKAENALARLRQLSAPQVWALRSGELVRLPASDLVPGDVVRLEAGDRVPADGQIGEARHVTVDESVVTGESAPVDKVAGDGVLAGTLIASGLLWCEVTATGPQSTMGRLAAMLGEVEAEVTPLERRLHTFGNRVARAVLVLAAVIALAGITVEGWAQAGNVLLFAVALAVAAVPEGLPAVLTVTLAMGVERMARREAVVRRLAAVEALGSVTVIATDKTGTLTENRMEVRGIDAVDEERALRAMILANDAEPGGHAGDPVDHALLAYAGTRQVDVAARRAAFVRRASRPFDAAWRFAHVAGEEAGRMVSYVKGAPEVVLRRSRLDDATRAGWEERLQEHAAEGFRLLGLASGEGERDDDLDWLGLVLLWDPPRAEVPAAIAAARAAGIRVIMVTGDHPATAATVATTVGIAPGRTVTGAEVQTMDALALRQAVATAAVFARVAPEHKLRIVDALTEAGEIVAMTGDGVNDAPALKRAAVGIAMGQRGSDVSREVADLVLLDDNFATIVAAIEEGRSISESIQKFIRFLFATNFAEVLVVTAGAVIAFALGLRAGDGTLLLPLTAAQLLWINLVTDGAPALALGLDRSPGVMQMPPRPPQSPLLDQRSLRFVGVAGAGAALLSLGLLGLLPIVPGESLDATRTASFLFLALAQLALVYPARRGPVRPPRNRVLHATIAGSAVAQLALLLVPALRAAFDMVPPSLGAGAWVAVALIVSWMLAEAAARVFLAKTT
jgi:Ca2+-transporting ATPase